MGKTWGQMIEQARDDMQLTQEQAAFICGVSTRTWERWAADHCVPRIPESQMTVAALGLDPKEAGKARKATGEMARTS